MPTLRALTNVRRREWASSTWEFGDSVQNPDNSKFQQVKILNYTWKFGGGVQNPDQSRIVGNGAVAQDPAQCRQRERSSMEGPHIYISRRASLFIFAQGPDRCRNGSNPDNWKTLRSKVWTTPRNWGGGGVQNSNKSILTVQFGF